MADSIEIWLPNDQNTRSAGASLAKTLYTNSVTILLTGELGAGKTTFLQGFAAALGIPGPLVSPTFALEQRHTTADGMQFMHMDLYRLSAKDAAVLTESGAQFEGIRCIEWADRLQQGLIDGPVIRVVLTEQGEGRHLRVDFEDIDIPTRAQVEAWRNDVQLPAHIVAHCDAVARAAATLADRLCSSGHLVRKTALLRAGELHDLLRFVDFKPGASPEGVTPTTQQQEQWKRWRQQYAGLSHEQACVEFLSERGFAAIAHIVAQHGVKIAPSAHSTIEQKLLYYADKRVVMDRLVTLEERFEDFARRYSAGALSDEQRKWYEHAKAVERELFPDGAPALVTTSTESAD
jgi:tRNA threonylcarbamoyladenosine biosynthesis protein TsaE